MAGLLERWFRRVNVVPMKLSFALAMDARGRHVVHIRKSSTGPEEPVADARPLLQYGYRETTPDGRTVYVVSQADWQALQAIGSLNPEFAPDGALVFDVLPPVLAYLRQKENIVEDAASQALTVTREPLRPAATVSFDPAKGATVTAGYRVGNAPELIPQADLQVTPNGQWARLGDHFAPLPKNLTPTQSALLKQGVRQVALKDIPEFFQRDLVLYRTEFNAVLTDQAEQVRVIDQPMRPVFHLDQSEPGWLSYRVDYQAGEVALPAEKVGKDQNYVRVNDNTWLKVKHKTVDAVNAGTAELGAVPTPTGYRVPVQAFASLEEFIQQTGGQTVVTEAYQHFLDQLLDFREDDAFPLSAPAEADLAGANITLRPYQRGGVHWLDWLSTNGLHGILADDMGLGKTLQTIEAIRMAYEKSGARQHSLIVAPKSVLYHWDRELGRYFPTMQRCVYHGADRRRDLLQSSQPVMFISTYATVSNDIGVFAKMPLFYLVLDEATAIKNPAAARTNAVKTLNAAHRLALTGTPVENRPAELWSLFDFLMRGHMGSQATFEREFETPIVAGDAAAAARLGRRIRPFILRRTKSTVAKDLPEKIETLEWCELTPEQSQLYGEMQTRATQLSGQLQAGETVNYAASILPVLTYLLQICDHPAIINHRQEPIAGRSEKFDWVVEKIDEILDGSEQVVVFSRFLEMLSLLEQAVRASNMRYIRIDGSTNDRQQLIDLFNDHQAQVALCSPLAAGHGINLIGANHVIHADRWWNPAVEDQATDRVHRIGQSRTVYVHRIITGGTLEERLNKLLIKKRDMAGRIIDAAGGPMGGWTREELIELLKPLSDGAAIAARNSSQMITPAP